MRRYKKITAKARWFKRKGQQEKSDDMSVKVKAEWKPMGEKSPTDVPPETVIFVPHTPGGELKKTIQDIDDQVMGGQKFGRVKVIEKLGTSLIDSLGNQAPWRSSHCGRSACWPCKAKEGSCRKHNILYKITCMTCQGQGKVRLYWGESHRSGWDRSADHAAALRSKDESYAIVKHWINDHPEGQPDYKFEVMRSFRSSLERQVMELIHIDEGKPEVRLNSKSEWG